MNSTNGVLISLLLVIAAGFGAGKLSIFDAGARKTLSKFVFYIATSALIISSLSGLSSSDLSKLPDFALVNCVIYITLFGIVYGLLRLLKVPYKLGGSIMYAGTTANIVYLGIPVMKSMFGAEGVLFTIALLTIPSIIIDILDFYFLSRWRHGKASMKKVLKEFITNPIIISSIVGFALLAIGINLPAPIVSSLDFLGAGATGIALFAMGLFLSESSLKGIRIKPTLVTSFIKLSVAPGIAYGVGTLLGLEGVALSATVILASMPSAIFCMVVATEYELDERVTADTILLSSILFLVTLSAWIRILGLN